MKIIKELIYEKNEKKFLSSLRQRNTNLTPSIIFNNCIAGIIYHNLGLPFNSPTINLSIPGNDYLSFVKNIEYYASCELVETPSDNSFPMGKLVSKDSSHQDISLHFLHYKTFEQAHEKWTKRFSRIDYNNIYYIWEFYDDQYDVGLIKEFDSLPLKKIALLHRDIPEIKHSFVISCYKEGKPVGKIFEHNGISGKRFLDEFDYTSFLNS